jgi:hypothetical protein
LAHPLVIPVTIASAATTAAGAAGGRSTAAAAPPADRGAAAAAAIDRWPGGTDIRPDRGAAIDPRSAGAGTRRSDSGRSARRLDPRTRHVGAREVHPRSGTWIGAARRFELRRDGRPLAQAATGAGGIRNLAPLEAFDARPGGRRFGAGRSDPRPDTRPVHIGSQRVAIDPRTRVAIDARAAINAAARPVFATAQIGQPRRTIEVGSRRAIDSRPTRRAVDAWRSVQVRRSIDVWPFRPIEPTGAAVGIDPRQAVFEVARRSTIGAIDAWRRPRHIFHAWNASSRTVAGGVGAAFQAVLRTVAEIARRFQSVTGALNGVGPILQPLAGLVVQATDAVVDPVASPLGDVVPIIQPIAGPIGQVTRATFLPVADSICQILLAAIFEPASCIVQTVASVVPCFPRIVSAIARNVAGHVTRVRTSLAQRLAEVASGLLKLTATLCGPLATIGEPRRLAFGPAANVV